MNNTKRKSHRQKPTGFSFWRREGDSNPRTGLSRYTISNRAPSTSSAISPNCLISIQHIPVKVKQFFSKERSPFAAFSGGASTGAERARFARPKKSRRQTPPGRSVSGSFFSAFPGRPPAESKAAGQAPASPGSRRR